MNDEQIKKTLEGMMADTSAAAPEEEEGTVELNNAPQPTVEEQEHAAVENIVEEEQPSDTVVPEPDPGEGQGEEPSPNPIDETEPEVESVPEATATKSFSQSQVDEIAGKVRKETREKVLKDMLGRYGVNTVEELDDLMGDAQRFMTSQDEFTEKEKAWNEQSTARDQELIAVKERVALLESGIDQNRFEDARLILKGKGLEVTADNIAAELATHPEWKKATPTAVDVSSLPFKKVTETPTTIKVPTIETLGNNGNDTPQPELSEREKALKMFKV